MELADYLNLLRRRWISVVAIAALAFATAVGVTLMSTAKYTATSQVFVSVRSDPTTSEMIQGVTYTQRAVRTYVQLVNTPRVLDPVIANLGLSGAPEVRADSPLDTSLINISATSEYSQLAADIANSTADSLADFVAELTAAGGESLVQLTTVRHAVAPYAPSSPNVSLNLALGLLVGAALGFGYALVRELLDTKVRTVADINALTDASVIGTIPYIDDASDHPLIVQESPHSLRPEAFRRLRTNLQFLGVDDSTRALIVTSSLPTEGKSSTAINLAITLAHAGAKVALVDADLRRPSVHEYLGVHGKVGLTTVLIGRATLDDVIQPWGNGNLDIIAAGMRPPNPSELLGSNRMNDLMTELCERYDTVIIDSSPLLPVTDAAVLARLAGGAVMVVGAGTITKAQLAEAFATLSRVDAPVLGVVVNRALTQGSSGYGYTYYEYASLADNANTKNQRSKLDIKDLSNRILRRPFGEEADEKNLAPEPTSDWAIENDLILPDIEPGNIEEFDLAGAGAGGESSAF
ncbi:MAG: polysaccharide biosynthesis tyrosine autokinase [Cellulomonadaceae bacterium]|jgi:capsular exopolysaccharide synthesis family protein|nr:polysaccharide biosynthesis tyrosine autokinase [Cellulomonadaceae bacterium]